jgi:adenosine kinase
MPALICGSLAFDTITNFPGRFAQQILPEQVHILNVSFLVPSLRREFGGCAGNIAYNLSMLGGEAVVLAALGSDGADYKARMASWGLDPSLVRTVADSYTAQAIIITDADNNQITAFHPGAMQEAHLTSVPSNRPDLKIGIVSPDGREAMLQHAEQMAIAGIPFIFDPGQGLPMFDGDELRRFVSQATWIAVNDYEGRMLCDRLETTTAELSTASQLKAVIVTLGGDGCELWIRGTRTHIPGVKPRDVLDPTGCGDAFRAALLFGLERGWSAERCADLGNRLGAEKIASRGGQNHTLDLDSLGLLDA